MVSRGDVLGVEPRLDLVIEVADELDGDGCDEPEVGCRVCESEHENLWRRVRLDLGSLCGDVGERGEDLREVVVWIDGQVDVDAEPPVAAVVHDSVLLDLAVRQGHQPVVGEQ